MQLLALKTVLVATDLRDTSAAAIEAARGLAEAAGAMLHLVHVIAPDTQDAEAATHELLRRAGVPVDSVSVHALPGDPPQVIGRLADELKADAIVIGPHRMRDATDATGDARELGTAIAVATDAAAPCLVVPRAWRLPLHHVVVGVDMSDTSRGALAVALSWASALRRTTEGDGRCTITAVYVDEWSGGDTPSSRGQSLEQHVDEVRKEAGSWAGVTIESKVLTGTEVTTTLEDFAEQVNADLIVLGTRGLGMDPVGRIGSVAGKTAREAEVPVLLVPPAVWSEHTQPT